MSSPSATVELHASGVRFFSAGDESAFFGWLKSLSCVKHIEGRGRTIYISVDVSAIDDNGLRELLALFHRYEVDMAQLIAFDRDEFAGWFRRRNSYWHRAVFG